MKVQWNTRFRIISPQLNSSWWLNQPLYKILVQLEIFPKVRGEKNIFQTTTQNYLAVLVVLVAFAELVGLWLAIFLCKGLALFSALSHIGQGAAPLASHHAGHCWEGVLIPKAFCNSLFLCLRRYFSLLLWLTVPLPAGQSDHFHLPPLRIGGPLCLTRPVTILTTVDCLNTTACNQNQGVMSIVNV